MNHVGRVCDKRRGWCPYADKHPLNRHYFGNSVMMVADVRMRAGDQGANRGKSDPFMKTGIRKTSDTEAWGPPMSKDVPSMVPED